MSALHINIWHCPEGGGPFELIPVVNPGYTSKQKLEYNLRRLKSSRVNTLDWEAIFSVR